MLVGGVVSINHEVETDPVPELPYASRMSAALTVRRYVPSAAVRGASPSIWYVSPETNANEAPVVEID